MSIKHGDIVKHKRKDLRIKVSWADHSRLNGYDQNGHYRVNLRQEDFKIIQLGPEIIQLWSEPEECMLHQDHSEYWKGCTYERTETSVAVGTAGGELSMKTTKMYRILLDNKPTTVKVSDLKGTVEMVDGKPVWSTYKES